ncbi:MAG: four helix bundle protein [Clostridia bacterium]|jgi:four helix bundle protein|nr:four helix bundle protein [Clostridia bacterium]MBR5422476.1 four helix bundle protein [Clostridia bacterium]
MVRHFKELLVWQRAIDLVAEVYKLIRFLPKEEVYALSSQMRRSAVSIPSNIAEGQQRRTTKEFIHFLSIARGSCAELETQFYICVKLGYLEESQIVHVLDLIDEIGKMLNGLLSKLQLQ